MTVTKGVPSKIVADRGTESVFIAGSQRLLRRNHKDDLVGNSSFLFGKSIANQRMMRFVLSSGVHVLTGGYSFSKDLFSVEYTITQTFYR